MIIIVIFALFAIAFSQMKRGMGGGRGMGRGMGRGPGNGMGGGRGMGRGKRMGGNVGGGFGGGGFGNNANCGCSFCQNVIDKKKKEGAVLEHVKIEAVKDCVSKYCADDSCNDQCEEKMDELLKLDSCEDFCKNIAGRGCGICSKMLKNFEKMDTIYNSECSQMSFRPKCQKMFGFMESLKNNKTCIDVCL